MRNKKSGLALVIVLFSTVILTMMVGAFFVVNQDNLSLGRAAEGRLKAQLAAESGLSYARFKLEQNQTWGQGGFTGYPEVLGSLTVRVDGSDLFGTGIRLLRAQDSDLFFPGNLLSPPPKVLTRAAARFAARRLRRNHARPHGHHTFFRAVDPLRVRRKVQLFDRLGSGRYA